MGQLFVVNDCVTQEELLKHISRMIVLRSQKKRNKASCKTNRLFKKTKLSFTSNKKVVKNSNNFVGQELSNLKEMSSSSQTCTISSLSSSTVMADGMFTNSEDSHINETSSSVTYVSDCAKINKNGRKRKRVAITDEDRAENLLIQKPKKSSGILRKAFKRNIPSEKNVKSELIISRQVDYENNNKLSVASNEEKSSASCDSTSVRCTKKTFTQHENMDLCYQHGVGSNKLVDSDDEVNICNRGVGKLTNTCRQMKIRRKHVGKTEKLKRKAVKDTAILSECDSKKHREEYLSDDTGSIDKKIQSCSKSENEVSEIMNSELTQNDNNGSFCLGRVFDNESITVTDPADVEPKCESNQETCNDTSLELSRIRKIPDQMYVAVDCEMVGVGPKGRESVLARCSIVDYDGNVVYDRYVRPSETITDYRTRWSGIRPVHMTKAVPIDLALKDIKECLEHKVIIGHAVYHDFKVLGIVPDNIFVRDTAQCQKLVEMAQLQGRGNSLKKLSEALLDRNIQDSMHGHCSVEDARATLDLFKLVRHSWEPDLYLKWSKKDSNICNKIANFVESSVSSEDFLNDKFWPSHILD